MVQKYVGTFYKPQQRWSSVAGACRAFACCSAKMYRDQAALGMYYRFSKPAHRETKCSIPLGDWSRYAASQHSTDVRSKMSAIFSTNTEIDLHASSLKGLRLDEFSLIRAVGMLQSECQILAYSIQVIDLEFFLR